MTDKQRLIFRPDAVQRYLQGRETLTSPTFITSHYFRYLWSLLGMLLGTGMLLSFSSVPVYTSGSGIIVNQKQSLHPDGSLGVVAFLPPQSQPQLRVGQRVLLRLNTGASIERPVVAVEPTIISPATAQQKFGLSNGANQHIMQPAAIVITQLYPMPVSASVFVGSVLQVDVEVGSRRIGSLIPGLGRLFESMMYE